MALRLVSEREADRAALARALHDEAAQTLANVALHLQICERAIAVDVERGRAELANARTALGEAINRLRQQVFKLRPLILDEVGVGPTLRRYLSTLPERQDRAVEVVDGLGATRLDRTIELGMYRIAQTAVDAAGGKLVVELGLAGPAVTLTLRHDQPGFEPPVALSQWVTALDAEMDVHSDATGVVVCVRIPQNGGVGLVRS